MMTLAVDGSDVNLDMTDTSNNAELSLNVPQVINGTYDYNELINKPLLNSKTIQGDMAEIDPTVPSWAKNSTKPVYTAPEVEAVPEDNVITIQEINEIFEGLTS